MSKDVYPGKQIGDNPLLKKGAPSKPSLVDLGAWAEAEGNSSVEEAIRALRRQQLQNEMLQKQLELKNLRRELECREDSVSNGGRSDVVFPPLPPPPSYFEAQVCPPSYPPGLADDLAARKTKDRPPSPPIPGVEKGNGCEQVDLGHPPPPLGPPSKGSSVVSSSSNKSRSSTGTARGIKRVLRLRLRPSSRIVVVCHPIPLQMPREVLLQSARRTSYPV